MALTLPEPMMVAPPSMAELTTRASLIGEKKGGAAYAHKWICHDCGTENQPTDNLLLKLHPIRCISCNKQNPTSYVWSMTNCVVNQVDLDIPIHNQGSFSTCTAHALISGMDLSRRIDGALHGLTVCQELDIIDLFGKYYELLGDQVLGEEDDDDLKRRRYCSLLHIAQIQGVAYMNPPKDSSSTSSRWQTPLPSLGRVLKIKGCFVVHKSDTDLIVRLLAGGYPLLTGIPLGRCFRFLASGQIYIAPHVRANHAVLLIGSGVANWPGEALPGHSPGIANRPIDPPVGPRIFYKARGSYGDRFHPDHQRDGMGGDFDIWADEIHEDIWGFHLPLMHLL